MTGQAGGGDVWRGALRDFGAHLEAQRAAFGEGRPEAIVAFAFPAGRVPPELTPEAEALLEESLQLEGAALTALDTLARQQIATTRSISHARSTQTRRTVAGRFDAAG